MPRLPPSVVRSASRLNKHVPRLLQECGDTRSACNELRWMKQCILDTHSRVSNPECDNHQSAIWSRRTSLSKELDRYVARRARGEPLQYILGTQPFGELEIKCRPQVLIPRGDTEVYTTQIAETLASSPYLTNSGLNIADFCTGSGCIALLLYSLLRPRLDLVQSPGQKLRIHGFDISQHALDLARENLHHNVRSQALHGDATSEVSFHYADVLALASMPMSSISAALPTPDFDIVVSNPPYISPQQFSGGPTSRSVRKFEPRLALVPPEVPVFPDVEQADQFYVALLRIAIAARAKLLVLEVGDTTQALRVARVCTNMGTHIKHDFLIPHTVHVEIWKDDGEVTTADMADPNTQRVACGAECRAVVAWLDPSWIFHRLESIS